MPLRLSLDDEREVESQAHAHPLRAGERLCPLLVQAHARHGQSFCSSHPPSPLPAVVGLGKVVGGAVTLDTG